MNLTNPQLASLVKVLSEQYAWAGSVRLRQQHDVLDEHGHGLVQVDVYYDTDQLHSFVVDVVGKVLAHV